MSKSTIAIRQIAHGILHLRGRQVMLDYDLAALYGVEARALNQAVKRNASRFPSDFMFQLSGEETKIVSQLVILSPKPRRQSGVSNSSQTVMSSRKHRGKRYRPFAFTEHGVAMLSSVLKSERAVKVNIAIMRAFVQLRRRLETNRELARKFAELDQRVGQHDKEIVAIIDAIRQLMAPPEKPRRQIGFHAHEKEPRYRTRNRR
jgi:hypothetical protein